jgi:hypothetical protein
VLPGGQARSVREREAGLTWGGHWSGLHNRNGRDSDRWLLEGLGRRFRMRGSRLRHGDTAAQRPKDPKTRRDGSGIGVEGRGVGSSETDETLASRRAEKTS